MKTFYCYLLLVLSLLVNSKLSAQAPDTISTKSSPSAQDTSEVLAFAEVMPEFPGGQEAFTKYLQDNIVYPAAEKKAKKQGSVYVTFVVMRTGTVEGVRVLKGVPNAPGLSEEAVRVLKSMPKWTPGTMNGKAVNVQLTVPITFRLTGGRNKKSKD